jgi:hypothetical protein
MHAQHPLALLLVTLPQPSALLAQLASLPLLPQLVLPSPTPPPALPLFTVSPLSVCPLLVSLLS